jgi:hypothetical protein
MYNAHNHAQDEKYNQAVAIVMRKLSGETVSDTELTQALEAYPEIGEFLEMGLMLEPPKGELKALYSELRSLARPNEPPLAQTEVEQTIANISQTPVQSNRNNLAISNTEAANKEKDGPIQLQLATLLKEKEKEFERLDVVSRQNRLSKYAQMCIGLFGLGILIALCEIVIKPQYTAFYLVSIFTETSTILLLLLSSHLAKNKQLKLSWWLLIIGFYLSYCYGVTIHGSQLSSNIVGFCLPLVMTVRTNPKQAALLTLGILGAAYTFILDLVQRIGLYTPPIQLLVFYLI